MSREKAFPIEPAENDRILISRKEIIKARKELSEQIAREYKGKRLVIVGILKGGALITAGLINDLHDLNFTDFEVDFIVAGRYGKETSSTKDVEIKLDTEIDLEDLDVLLVDDILDDGVTLLGVTEHLQTKKPRSVEQLAFYVKRRNRSVNISPKFIGKHIPDVWVYGGGLDTPPYVGRALPDLWFKPNNGDPE